MRITSNRPDAENSLFAFFARALARLGARVERSQTENLVRKIGVRGHVATPLPPFDAPPPLPHVLVQVEGLPNLVHEVGHLLLRGVLDDDHGIDYQAIPFDLDHPDGRAVLWEEMACCALSCGYPAAIEGAAGWAAVDAWFREQVEIQPVFYGFDGRPDAFWTRVEAAYAEDDAICEATVATAYVRTEGLLRWAGAPPGVAAPGERLSFGTLLRRARHPMT